MQPDPARLELAASFLQEAVYRSRGRQAAGVELKRGASPAAGNCGLGEKAALELDLSARGRELAAELWPAGLEGEHLARVRAELAAWVIAQDALDRKRNHFLRDFRQQHGFDRTQYAPETLRAFEQGLEQVNAEESRQRRAAAERVAG